MRRPRTVCVLALLAGVAAAGCSNVGESSSSATSSRATSTTTAAMCASLDTLQDSVSALADVPVRDGGIAAVQAAFTEVQDDAGQLVDAAQDQHGSQADRLSTDVSAVQSALADAGSAPLAASLQVVGTTIATLVNDLAAMADDVGSTC
jgi:hypothetical protein